MRDRVRLARGRQLTAQRSRRRTTTCELAEADDAEADPRRAPSVGHGLPSNAAQARNAAVTITRVGRSQTVTTPTSVMPAAAGPGPQVLLQQHQRPAERADRQRRPGGEQRAEEQQVADAVGDRVEHLAPPRGPPGQHGDRAVEVVEQAGQHDHRRRQQQPPAAGRGRARAAALTSTPATVTTSGGTPAAASGRATAYARSQPRTRALAARVVAAVQLAATRRGRPSRSTGRQRCVAEAELLVDLARRRRRVERDEVQPGHALGEQPLAQLGRRLDADLAHRVRVVLDRVQPLGQLRRERRARQLWRTARSA